MPANTVALITLAVPSSIGGVSFDEQASTVSPGNKFDDDGTVLLYVRNTTATAINVIFNADVLGGNERQVLSTSIPGNGTENGVKILGPFSKIFLDHTTTSSADNGKVMVRQATGTNGQLQFCPFRINPNLRNA